MNSRSFVRSAALVALIFGVAGAALALDWPQWRGPARDGLSKETGLLKEWPEGGPPELWHVSKIGDGYSTPVIRGDRIYILGNNGLDNEFVQALSTKDGSQIWSTKLG